MAPHDKILLQMFPFCCRFDTIDGRHRYLVDSDETKQENQSVHFQFVCPPLLRGVHGRDAERYGGHYLSPQPDRLTSVCGVTQAPMRVCTSDLGLAGRGFLSYSFIFIGSVNIRD
jgi:hypothetical protein